MMYIKLRFLIKKTLYCLFLALSCVGFFYAVERTEPVCIYILIDTSLSMAEENRFEEVKLWLVNDLLADMITIGDTLVVYEFYGKTDKILDTTIKNRADIEKIRNFFLDLSPDNAYTDIMFALETLKYDINAYRMQHPNTFIIALLLTDMLQEAPYTSQYATLNGNLSHQTVADFDTPYMPQDRVVSHGSWFEVAINTSDPQDILTKSAELYNILKMKD